MSTVADADDRNHTPESNASPDWQESFVLCWYDPVKRIGGFHHTGMQRVRRIADAWSWIAQNGIIVHKFFNNELPFTDDDYSNLRLGPFHLQSERPLTHRRLLVKDRIVSADLIFAASGETIGLSYDVGGTEMGKGHWENFGRVAGPVTIAGVNHDVIGVAFQDRSWGARDWGSLNTYRWIWASFGDDLIMSVYNVVGNDGAKSFGHVFDRGAWHKTRSVEVRIEMASDGVSPLASNVEIWLEDGSGYSLRGLCDGSSIQTHRDGFMMANACTRYSFGGRLGAGFIEVSELKRPNAQLARVLEDAGLL